MTGVPTWMVGLTLDGRTASREHALDPSLKPDAAGLIRSLCGVRVIPWTTRFASSARPCARCTRAAAKLAAAAAITPGPRKVSAAHVTKVLKAVPGLSRAQWLKSSRIKGWGRWTSGFQVEMERVADGYDAVRRVSRTTGLEYTWRRERRVNTGRVFIGWILGDWYRGTDAKGEIQAQLHRCADALTAAGYAVIVEEGRLVVTRP